MGQSSKLVIIIAFLAVSTMLFNFTYAQATEWSDWYKLEDKALNGIYFSHKKECPSGNNTSCSLIWRWQSRYEGAVQIDYQITYETSAGTKIKNGRLMLQSGVNESPVFAINGKTLEGVSVGIIASEQAKAKAREEVAREHQKNEERKIRDNEEARRNQERARIAALQQQEHERRRIQEEKRQKEEDKRKDDLREEQEQARIAQQQADRNAFNQQLVAGINQLGNTTVNSINSYYGVKNAGIEAENRAREQQRLAQLDAERERKERERPFQTDTVRLGQPDKSHDTTSFVTAKVIEPDGGKDNSVTNYAGKYSDWVIKLLDRSGPWSCPDNPPKIKAKQCARDASVAAAVSFAWAAECYAEQGEKNRATAHAEEMYKNLMDAKNLCSDAPSFAGAKECDTMNIFACPQVKKSSSPTVTEPVKTDTVKKPDNKIKCEWGYCNTFKRCARSPMEACE